MFDMSTNAGDSGYQLRITYDSTDGLYTLNGYIVYPTPSGYEYEKDGGPLHFNSLEDAIKHITDFPSKQEMK